MLEKNFRVVNNYMPELLAVLVINVPFDCMHASVTEGPGSKGSI